MPSEWKAKRREGFSLVECLIMMIVLVITIGATMQTIVWAMGLQVLSREEIGARTFINNWFEVFEALPHEMAVSADMNSIREEVEWRMGRKSLYRYEAARALSSGICAVVLEVWPSSAQMSIRAVKSVNLFSSSPAPDNSKYENDDNN